jgi:hypothetical protein
VDAEDAPQALDLRPRGVLSRPGVATAHPDVKRGAEDVVEVERMLGHGRGVRRRAPAAQAGEPGLE